MSKPGIYMPNKKIIKEPTKGKLIKKNTTLAQNKFQRYHVDLAAPTLPIVAHLLPQTKVCGHHRYQSHDTKLQG